MKSEKLYEAIGDIDEKLISKAESFKKKTDKKRVVPFIASLAAVFVLIAALGILGPFTFSGTVLLPDNGTLPGNEETTLTEESTRQPAPDETLPTDYQESTSLPENNEHPEEKTTSIGLLPPPEDVTQSGFVNPHTTDRNKEIKPVTLAKASYPKTASYPLLGELDPRYDKWWEDKRELLGIEVETDSIKAFSKTLMSELLTDKRDENNIVSPLNIYMAMGMLAEASGGSSRQQILELLGEESIDSLRDRANKIWQKNYRNDGAMKSIMANSLWLNDTVSYNKTAVKTISEKYFASVYSGTMGSQKYNKLLNDWLYENTDRMLKPDVQTDYDTVMSIASTMVFSSKWSDEFQKSNTESGIFHTPAGDKNVSFMKATRDMYYFWGEKYSAISLSLNIGGQMWFILPDEGVDADEIFKDSQMLDLVTREDIYGDSYENGKFLEVNMSIPKFDVKSEKDVMSGLEKLGITDVTDELRSDFSPLATNPEGIFIDKIDHGVRVKIDEEGVQAAAYTVIRGAGSAMPPDEKVDFVLDRPFVFVITLSDNVPLFAGVVNNP